MRSKERSVKGADFIKVNSQLLLFASCLSAIVINTFPKFSKQPDNQSNHK